MVLLLVSDGLVAVVAVLVPVSVADGEPHLRQALKGKAIPRLRGDTW